MDAKQRKRDTSLSCLSVGSDRSMEVPPDFSDEERTPPCAEMDRMDVHYEKRPTSPASPTLSLKSDASMTKPIHFNSGEEEARNMIPVAKQSTAAGPQRKTTQYDLKLPPLIEDWTKEHVKDWLVIKLRVPQKIAQILYDQELSGACLVSYEKQDLLELGVPPAPAIQIMRQVEKFMTHSGIDEIETVSLDSGIQSQSSAVQMLQMARNRIRSVIDQHTTDDGQSHAEFSDSATLLQLKRPICQIRPFDKSNSNIFYTQNDILPPSAGPSNLLDPVHEYQLLPCANEASEREILYEFTKEVFTFAASCMNSRTNGTIHFGACKQAGQGHGEVVGHTITSFSKYNEAFESCLSQCFEEQHVNAARRCIRPPNFIQVCSQDGTTSNKWVIEVDVVPMYLVTQQNLYYTLLSVASTENKQQCKTECLFVRDGPRSINILAHANPRILQEEIKGLPDKVECWASARKTAEEKDEKRPSQGHQGQRLKQLITRGRDAFENSLQVIVVTDKCHSSQLEDLDFLKEIKLFAVLDFDPESDVNGTCSFYRRDRLANLHYPRMYTAQDSLTAIIGKLNLFQQPSWVFCNGRANEEAETDKPLTQSEWLKKRSGDVNNMVSLLCDPDLLSRDGLVIFILHSAVTDISSPILETFCAIYRMLGGVSNILCICKNSSVFSRWQQLVELRCREDITSKCIYELSLNEISSTIKKLKEPHTKSSRRFLPSTGSSSALLAKKDEELMTALEILCENECQNTEIETKDSFQEFKVKTEEDFYRGGQVSWWNFYISEQKGSLPFIKRDKYDELYDLITPAQGYTFPCVMINLFHHPGCGGTTLAMHVLWNLRHKFRCAAVKNNMAKNEEVAGQVMKLLTYGKQEESGYTPVLLLVDNWDAFMIMANNFSEEYITNLVSNIVKDLDITTQQGRLFSFLALLNTYVNASYMSLALCEELVGIRNALWKRETLDDKMNPYSTLMITFTVEEHGTYQAVRFLHQLIASKCLDFLVRKYKISLAEITDDILHCDKIYKSCMGKDFLVQSIQSMLVARHRKEQGDDKDTLFSPLIEKIHEEEGPKKIKEVLERAIERFDRSATLPQVLARHFYLKEKDFKSALKWALDAQGKKSNSYIADTVGQVLKSELKKEKEDSEDLTPEALDKCLTLGLKAVNAFRESQELAMKDESDLHTRKKPKSYNTSGYVGETEVIMLLLDIIKELPLFSVSDRHKRDKMLQFLSDHHPVSNLYDHSNTTINQFVAVLENHERFLISLKPRLKEIFVFFETYFQYLKPRSKERETADERNKRKVSEYFKRYIQTFSRSEEEKASEKASKPKLSLAQTIVDHRWYLETKRADTFAGLLQCLIDKSGMEMEHILTKWQFILDNSPRGFATDRVNFILANIVLHSVKSSKSTKLKKYEDLVDLLNEELQKEGTHSNLTELYYLSMLLMWPTQDRRLEKSATYKNISLYVTSAKKSFHRRFSHMFPARTSIAHFFLGKSSGLKRIVAKVMLDHILISVSKVEETRSSQCGQTRNLHNLWQSGKAWNKPEIQRKLLRVKGKSENGEIYVSYGGSLKIPVRPVYLGDLRSGCSREDVSFYLGFTMEGPVAYDIKYENDQ